MNAKISSTIKAYQANQTKEVVNKAKRGDATMPKGIEASDKVATLMAVAPKADGTMTWDFEDLEAGLSPFTAEDKDGDGFNWVYFNNSTVDTSAGGKTMSAHGGDGLIFSASYDNDGAGALHPNNWLISPEVTLGGALKFWAEGQDANYAAEVFGVYVTVDGETWTQIGTDKTATGEYVEYEFDLSPYAGQTGKFAIVHHNVTDMFLLNIDDITFDPSGEVTPEPGLPTNVTVVPTATTGEVAWVAGENNGSWDLRWRPYVDPAMQPRFWDLNSEDQLDGWMIYDADQDGYSWGYSYLDDPSDCLFYSASYANYTDLTPDNWLFTPEVKLGGTLKFDTWNYSSNYPDRIMVYVCDNPDWESVDEFVAISDFIQPGEDPETIELDLSEYEGTGYIAIVHHNVTDMFRLNIDDVEILVPNPTEAEAAEWIVVENVTNPYTIEGLTPETEYEVQVQAVGQATSAWTASTNFTTLAEQVEQGYYLVGNFSSWLEGDNRIEFVKEGDTYVATDVVLEAGDEFKIITPAEDGGWIWYGGEHADTDEFLVMPQYYNNYTEITLVPNDPKGNFKMEYGPATYKITIKTPSTTGDGIAPKALQEPIVMVMEKTTGIDNINVDKAGTNEWYNLNGQKLNGKPSTPGIYINGGKKVIVR